MRFAIRDDDTSYFTTPEDLERVWGRVLPYAPVSLAVTPCAFQFFHPGDAERFYQSAETRELGDNSNLVCWLQQRLSAGQISVLCHGYTHEYQRVSRRRLIEEYVWKPYARMHKETRLARLHLETVLGRAVNTFVPPGNAISRSGLLAVRPHFANVVAAVPLRRWYDLRPEWDTLTGYARRLYFQARHGIPNPRPDQVAGVRLLPSFSLTRQGSWEQIRHKFDLCRRLGADFIVAVHYWEMNARLSEILDRLLEHASRAGCRFTHCQELLWSDSKIS